MGVGVGDYGLSTAFPLYCNLMVSRQCFHCIRSLMVYRQRFHCTVISWSFDSVSTVLQFHCTAISWSFDSVSPVPAVSWFIDSVSTVRVISCFSTAFPMYCNFMVSRQRCYCTCSLSCICTYTDDKGSEGVRFNAWSRLRSPQGMCQSLVETVLSYLSVRRHTILEA